MTRLATALALLLGACTPAGAGGDAPDAGVAAADAGAPDAGSRWSACPLYTGTGGSGAECAAFAVPLRWSEPEGRRIEVSVKRVVSRESRGSLFLLQGGPGASALVFEATIAAFTRGLPGIDVYLFEHRGVGLSTRLGCAAQEATDSADGFRLTDAELVPCVEAAKAEWGADLAAFSTTEAARDLAAIIEQVRGDKPVFVYGVSYGTYWAQRYLQVQPARADGVVLDSICAPGKCHFPLGFAEGADVVGRALLKLCNADAECSARLGGDGEALLAQALATLGTGACKEVAEAGFTADRIRTALFSFTANVDHRGLVPGLVKRLTRCDDDDVAALQSLWNALQPLPRISADERAHSSVLYFTVGAAELRDDPMPDDAAYRTRYEQLLVAPVSGPGYLEALRRAPDGGRDDFFGKAADTAVPMLMMNGTLDPQTTMAVAQDAATLYTKAHQTFVEVPNAAHGIITQARYDADPSKTCGWDLIAQFLADPRAPLDTSCRLKVRPPDFGDNMPLARALLGTDSAWGGEAKGRSRVPRDPAAEAAIRERAREEFRRASPAY